MQRFSRSRPLAMDASVLGSSSPAIMALNIARPDAPTTSVATELNLMLPPFQHLPNAVDHLRALPDQLSAMAAQLSQLPLRTVRDEARP